MLSVCQMTVFVLVGVCFVADVCRDDWCGAGCSVLCLDLFYFV